MHYWDPRRLQIRHSAVFLLENSYTYKSFTYVNLSVLAHWFLLKNVCVMMPKITYFWPVYFPNPAWSILYFYLGSFVSKLFLNQKKRSAPLFFTLCGIFIFFPLLFDMKGHGCVTWHQSSMIGGNLPLYSLCFFSHINHATEMQIFTASKRKIH